MTATATGPAPTHLLLADIELQENCRLAVVEDDKLAELAASIREVGVLQSLLVEPRRGGFALVAGYRRARAAEIAGVTTVPIAVIAPGLDPLTANLVENLHRVDLSPIEKARGILRMMEQGGKNQTTVARECGWSLAYVNQLVTLHERLCPDARDALHHGRIGWARAQEIRNQPHEVQLRMLATGPRKRPPPPGRRSAAEGAMIEALAAYRRGEEDAALVSARQAVHELERRHRDGRTQTPRPTPAPTATRDQAERATIARAAAPPTAATAKVAQPGPGSMGGPRPRPVGTARIPRPEDRNPAVQEAVARPMAPAGQRAKATDDLDADQPVGRPKLRCVDCKQWLMIHVAMTGKVRLQKHVGITGCEVAQQLRALK